MPKYQRRKFKQLIAVIYARFSCDKQRDESIEDQLRVCMEYAREHGITVIGQYCDYALSGRNDHRPQFLKMIADSQNGEFNTVLLWKMDRFARNRWDSAIYKKELFMNGVNVVSATEPIPEGGGIIMESIYDGMAEMYSVQISQNVKRAARGNALKSKSNGGNLLFGYKVNPVTRQYELDEEAAPIVEEIFNRAAAGKPVNTILDWLRGIGLNFSKCRIYTMLRNERYTGVYIYDGIRNDGGMPAIITKEKFNIVRARCSDRKQMHRHANKNYLFSKRCFCGLCGSTVTGEYSKRTAERTYYYYACQGHKLRHECDMKRMRADVVEKAACRVLADLLTQPDLMQHFISAALKYQQSITKENAELKMTKSRLVEVQARKNNLLSAIEQGIFTPSTAARLKELEADEDELKNNIENDFIDTMNILRNEEFQNLLVNYPRNDKSFIRAVDYVDEVTSGRINRYDGTSTTTKDYLNEFCEFVKNNKEQVEAIKLLFDSPKDWNTSALKEINDLLKQNDFKVETLQKIYGSVYHKSLVDIISMIKHAVKEDEELLTSEERVTRAINKLKEEINFSPEQEKWLELIKNHLIENLTIDKDDFELLPVFTRKGGISVARRIFNGIFDTIISRLNELIAA